MEWAEQAIKVLTERVEKLLRDLQDIYTRLRALEQTSQRAYQQWPSDSGGGGGGVYYADGLSIGGTSSGTGVTVYQSWSGSIDSSSATVYNPFPDACDSTKRQVMCKNPGGSYSIVAESCSPHP